MCKKCYSPKVPRTRDCDNCQEAKSSSLFNSSRSSTCNDCLSDPEYKRTCSKCNEDKTFMDHFPGYGNVCKKCYNKKPTAYKICKGCNKEKVKAEFRKAYEYCKECEDNGTKKEIKCNECGITKPSENFPPNRRKCRDCLRSHGREYRQTTTKAQEWYDNNKEKMASLQKNWYEDNKVDIRKKQSKRYYEDPEYKEIKLYRAKLSAFVHKKSHTCSFLRADHDLFINWMTHCFGDDMCMNNYPQIWHIDHVLPLDLRYRQKESAWCWQIIEEEDAFDILFAWFNTFPLPPSVNRTKGTTISYKHLIKHLRTLTAFVKENHIEKTPPYYHYVRVIRRIINELRK